MPMWLGRSIFWNVDELSSNRNPIRRGHRQCACEVNPKGSAAGTHRESSAQCVEACRKSSSIRSMRMSIEMKANKIAHKECYEIALEDLSRIGVGLFETNKAPYSIFNQTENVTIYLNSEHNETDITDLAKRKQFFYDVSHSADFNYTLDESDLERLSRKLKPLEILDEIVVI